MTLAGYLISRCAEQPPVLSLTVAIVGVRAFGISPAARPVRPPAGVPRPRAAVAGRHAGGDRPVPGRPAARAVGRAPRRATCSPGWWATSTPSRTSTCAVFSRRWSRWPAGVGVRGGRRAAAAGRGRRARGRARCSGAPGAAAGRRARRLHRAPPGRRARGAHRRPRRVRAGCARAGRARRGRRRRRADRAARRRADAARPPRRPGRRRRSRASPRSSPV